MGSWVACRTIGQQWWHSRAPTVVGGGVAAGRGVGGALGDRAEVCEWPSEREREGAYGERGRVSERESHISCQLWRAHKTTPVD